MADTLDKLFADDDVMTAALLRVLAQRLRLRVKFEREPRDERSYDTINCTVEAVLLPAASHYANYDTEAEGEVVISEQTESFSVG